MGGVLIAWYFCYDNDDNFNQINVYLFDKHGVRMKAHDLHYSLTLGTLRLRLHWTSWSWPCLVHFNFHFTWHTRKELHLVVLCFAGLEDGHFESFVIFLSNTVHFRGLLSEVKKFTFSTAVESEAAEAAAAAQCDGMWDRQPTEELNRPEWFTLNGPPATLPKPTTTLLLQYNELCLIIRGRGPPLAGCCCHF